MKEKININEIQFKGLTTAIDHIGEALKEKVFSVGLEIEVVDCGTSPIYVFVSGRVRTYVTGRTFEVLSAVHLSKKKKDWTPLFVDSHVNLNDKHGPEAEVNYTAAHFTNGQKSYCECEEVESLHG